MNSVAEISRPQMKPSREGGSEGGTGGLECPATPMWGALGRSHSVPSRFATSPTVKRFLRGQEFMFSGFRVSGLSGSGSKQRMHAPVMACLKRRRCRLRGVVGGCKCWGSQHPTHRQGRACFQVWILMAPLEESAGKAVVTEDALHLSWHGLLRYLQLHGGLAGKCAVSHTWWPRAGALAPGTCPAAKKDKAVHAQWLTPTAATALGRHDDSLGWHCDSLWFINNSTLRSEGSEEVESGGGEERRTGHGHACRAGQCSRLVAHQLRSLRLMTHQWNILLFRQTKILHQRGLLSTCQGGQPGRYAWGHHESTRERPFGFT